MKTIRWFALALLALAALDMAAGQAAACGRRGGRGGFFMARGGGGCGHGGCATGGWAGGTGTFAAQPGMAFTPGGTWVPGPSVIPATPSGPARPAIDDGPGSPEARSLPALGERVYRLMPDGSLHQIGWMRGGRLVPLGTAPGAGVPGSPEPRD